MLALAVALIVLGTERAHASQPIDQCASKQAGRPAEGPVLLGSYSNMRQLPGASINNVVLIVSDDQAWNDYGFMGHDAIETPRLDQLAKQSLTFTRGYATTSLCSPSLASIITGLYPAQHGVTGNDPAMPPGVRRQSPEASKKRKRDREKMIAFIDRLETIPRRLSGKGYVSLQTGKWWLGNYKRGGFTHGMTRGFPNPGGRHGDDGLAIGRKGIATITEFLDKSAAAGQPFFIWYAPLLPHTPHTPPPELLAKYREKTESLSIAKYWAMCEWFDQTCGEVLDAIDARKLTDNTIVLYVTDNGWINRPDASKYAPRSKRSPYDGGLRTPIMIRWPGKVEPRLDTTTLVSTIDIAPTVYQACGLNPAAKLPGVSLLNQQALAQRNQVFGTVYAHDIENLDNPAESLLYRWTVHGKQKAIFPNAGKVPEGVPELFEIADDPQEERNLASTNTVRLGELKQEVADWSDRTALIPHE